MCVPFGIFVCTRCSGIFRDFNFRIKSISASTFSGDEVEMLKRQGNDAARRTFLARWPQDRALPTSGDRVLGKNWIKAVFVDRMYYGDGGASQAPAASTAAPAATAQAAAAPRGDESP